jgi:hypothetical protein
LSYLERMGSANIADSADEVRLRVREQLFQGASQIKLVGGGRVASPRTALDMFTFSEPELRAGVEAAADRCTPTRPPRSCGRSPQGSGDPPQRERCCIRAPRRMAMSSRVWPMPDSC